MARPKQVCRSIRITGPEGNGVVLSVTETVARDQVVVAIERIGEEKGIQAIRLDRAAFDAFFDCKYQIEIDRVEDIEEAKGTL